MDEDFSRRTLLSLGSGFAISTLAGCLQFQGSETDTTTTNKNTQSASLSPSNETDTPTEETDSPTSTPKPVLESPWTISNEGSDILTHDGTFYLTTWLSREVIAVAPDGTEYWRGEQKGKFKRKSLTVNDSAIAGCGYGGQVTLFDQSNGEVRWNYTDAEYATWAYLRPYMNESFLVTVNEAETEDNQYTILIFDVETGEVVSEIPWEDRIEGVGLADTRLYVATSEYLDIYDTDSFSKITRISDFECLSIKFLGTEMIVRAPDGIIQYTLEGDSIEGKQLIPERASGSLGLVTDDSIYVRTSDSIARFSRNGDHIWDVDIDRSIGNVAVTSNTVYAVDERYQLYAIDRSSGELLIKKTLSPDGLPQPRVGAVYETAVVMNKPIQSFRRVSSASEDQ